MYARVSIFPIQDISGELAMITGLYAILASIVIILTLALREKVDKKAGALFIFLYLLSNPYCPLCCPLGLTAMTSMLKR